MKKLFRFIAGAIGKKRSFRIIDFLLHYNQLSIKDYFQHKFDKKELDGASVVGHAYRMIGINEMHGGEKKFIENTLPVLIKTKKPVFFDVGANIGEITTALHAAMPLATIHSFEPNPELIKVLEKNIGSFANIINKGLSDKISEANLFMNAENDESSLASMYHDVLTDLHLTSELKKVSIQLDVLDSFCMQHKIDRIDFLKIDTEGNELKVLKGAKGMIDNDRIGIIQFEFNEMNIVSRVFLKDFYDLLSAKYDFYRLTASDKIALGSYSSLHEIFRYQDMVLIHKNHENFKN